VLLADDLTELARAQALGQRGLLVINGCGKKIHKYALHGD